MWLFQSFFIIAPVRGNVSICFCCCSNVFRPPPRSPIDANDDDTDAHKMGFHKTKKMQEAGPMTVMFESFVSESGHSAAFCQILLLHT